ncbi:MAG: DUF6263 family protein [Ignavibacteria bacterium]|nr:DUF6263 family protein [Ignavibacteria bacterium]
MLKKAVFFLLSIFIFISFSACDKVKDLTDKKQQVTESRNEDLIIKDDKGEKVNLKFKPSLGDIFRYKLKIQQNSTDKSSLNKNKEIKSSQILELYYTNEVTEINESGIITFKVRYDSVKMDMSVSSPDSSISMSYNSNKKDEAVKNKDFMLFDALVGREFKARVTSLGEVTTLYDLEKVYDYIYKEYGDTLKSSDKEIVRKSIEDELKELIQTQFQMLPEKEVYVDSTWSYNQEAALGNFPAENVLTYKIESLNRTEKGIIIGLDANLVFKVIESSFKDKSSGLSYKLEDVKGEGSGKIELNLSRGCISKKDTKKYLYAVISASAKGQSAKVEKSDEIKLSLELL